MKKILLVDDKPENLYFLDTLLSSNGFAVDRASNGEQALDLARNNPPDMIIADVLMPVMDGFELCHKIKTDTLLKNAAFIFYTASYLDKGDEELALSLGVDRYLLKPQEPEVLLRVFNEVFDEHDAGKKNGVIPFPQEKDYLKHHGESLVRMLEKKIDTLNKTQLKLKEEIVVRKNTEEKLSALLLENEILLKEVYHRAKNNMQVMVGLFDLQSRKMGDQSVESVFAEMGDRIYSMSFVHDLLFRSKSLNNLSFDWFITNFSRQIISLDETDNTKINLIFEIDPVLVNIRVLVPLGLVIYEILSNTLKHAFRKRVEGQIFIKASLNDDDALLLTISDDGVGLDPDIDLLKSETLGMYIIRSVVENQLFGTVQVASDTGLTYTIFLPDLLLKD
ncbi:MAG: response regulator [Candidatus Marinimicrobia bacterium]|nr:response regulator [Candidatus Neomarinimicrobiota bacterium]